MHNYSQALKKLSNKASLFESDREMNGFLKEALSSLIDLSGSVMGAVYVYDDSSKQLVFRVGYDRNDFWDSFRCAGKKIPLSFSLDNSDPGKAFREAAVRVLEFSEEKPVRSKLIVPIVRGPEKLGVLMLAHPVPGAFSREDQGDLKRAASMLGDILIEATAFMLPPGESSSVPVPQSRVIEGLKASAGVASGKALPIWSDIDSIAETIAPSGSADTELERFEEALKRSSDQLERIEKSSSLRDSEMISLIFTAQLYMLKDSSFLEKMRSAITGGRPAAESVRDVIQEYAGRFAALPEARLAEKAQDVRDLGFRILSNLASPERKGFSYSDKIILSRHLYPSDLFRLAVEGVAGVVLKGAGVTAHISILARSLSVPVLISDDPSLLEIPEGLPMLLDATQGRLYVRPDEKIRNTILDRSGLSSGLPGYYILKGHLKDGTPVSVQANINILKDADDAVQEGAEGVGLYRSEFPFILKNDFLSEEQQYRLYRSIVSSQKGKPVTLRTADIGGDKLLQGRSQTEDNPFLGVRGIRFSLANREMFRDQLKAMLRAGEGADLGIMFPMVSGVEELLQAREELDLCIKELEQREEAFNSSPRVGAMVELPSAAISTAELARHSDFLSIGSNDLIMYLLAVDRTNENLSHLYRSHHPTVLKVLSLIVKDAGEKAGEISVCGDIASDPMLIPVLAGMGIRKLSVSPHSVEKVKQRLLQYSLPETEKITKEILSITRLDEMDEYMKEFAKRWPLP